MLLRLLLILSLVCVTSCLRAPKVKVCISDPSAHGFDCYDEATGQSSFTTYDNSDHFVAFPPKDAQALLEYCSKGND